MSSTCVTIVSIQTYRKTGRFIFWDAQYHIFYLEFTIFFILQRCSSSFLFNRSLIFSISSLELFSHYVSVALVSINPFLNFFCSIFVVSFPQNHCTSYICYLLIKANNLLADNLLYLIQNVFNYGIKDTKKVRFQIDLITCASMAQNDELKQTIHRYRVVLMDAMKIFLIFFVIFSFRSLIHNQRLFLVMIASQLR